LCFRGRSLLEFGFSAYKATWAEKSAAMPTKEIVIMSGAFDGYALTAKLGSTGVFATKFSSNDRGQIWEQRGDDDKFQLYNALVGMIATYPSGGNENPIVMDSNVSQTENMAYWSWGAMEGWGAQALQSFADNGQNVDIGDAIYGGGPSGTDFYTGPSLDALKTRGWRHGSQRELTWKSVPAGADTIGNATLKILATQLAPIVQFHPKEQFFPSSVEWYLGQSQLGVYRGSEIIVQPGGVNAGALGAVPNNGDGCAMAILNGNGVTVPANVFAIYTGEPLSGNRSNSKCYAVVRKWVDLNIYEINYCFFYPYNGGLPPGAVLTLGLIPTLTPIGPNGSYIINGDWGFYSHEGDWEHVTQVVSLENSIYTVDTILEAHGDSSFVRRASYKSDQINTMSSPTVYAAWHSHASYGAAGSADLPDTSLTHDITANGGATWDTAGNLQFIQEGNPYWVNYVGDWGSDTQVLAVPGLPYRKGGPNGPITKGWWTDPARVTVPLLD
jgi:hypothetical protein